MEEELKAIRIGLVAFRWGVFIYGLVGLIFLNEILKVLRSIKDKR